VGSVAFWIRGEGDAAGLLGRWAETWPWLLVGWWLAVPLPAMLSGQRYRPRLSDAALLLICVFAGTLLTGVTHLMPMPARFGLGFGEQMDLYDLLGENREFSRSREWVLGAAGPVRVENPYGSVRVRLSPDDSLRLDVLGYVRVVGPGNGDTAESGIRFDLERGPEGYRLHPRFDGEGDAALVRSFRTQLDLGIPAGRDIVIVNRGGGVEAVRFPANLEIRATDSHVLVREPAAGVVVRATRGDVGVVYRAQPGSALLAAVVGGDLRVELPSNVAVEVAGIVRSGSFRSDFPGIGPVGEAETLEIGGMLGNGPRAVMRFDLSGGVARLVDAGRVGGSR
jgi:hypothetical protein